MSPILLRPVREQLEHDRVIRLLQAKYRRKFEVAINPGAEQTAPITVGQSPWYPDLLLQATRGRKLQGLVEVETAESVNNLEAMSQWATFARQRVPLHLYVPGAMIDVAKRLCTDLQIPVAELWAYHALGDQVRFTLVQRSSRPSDGKARAARAASSRPAAAGRTRDGGRPQRRAAAAGPRSKAVKKTSTRAARARKGTARQKRK